MTDEEVFLLTLAQCGAPPLRPGNSVVVEDEEHYQYYREVQVLWKKLDYLPQFENYSGDDTNWRRYSAYNTKYVPWLNKQLAREKEK